jgi:hypothetical protein
MERFLAQHGQAIVGVLCGFDRVCFRGSLPSICNLRSLLVFLSYRNILFKDFGEFAQRQSEVRVSHAERYAQQQGRPVIYFNRRVRGHPPIPTH